jgi:hypothetical protein
VFERSPNKEGKEFVKFDDGLANVAGNTPAATATEPVHEVYLMLTICLPKFLPCNNRKKASGIRPIP